MAGLLGNLGGGLGTFAGAWAGDFGKQEGMDVGEAMADIFNAKKSLAPLVFDEVEKSVPRRGQIVMDATEDYYAGLDRIEREQNPEYYDFRERMTQEASDDLDRRGYLSSDEMRNLEQDTRAGWNDRGLVRSEPSVFGEVMNLYGARRGRLKEARNFVGRMMGVHGADRDRQMGRAMNAAGTDVNAMQSFFDPSQGAIQVAAYNANADNANSLMRANAYAGLGGTIGGFLGGVGDVGLNAATGGSYGQYGGMGDGGGQGGQGGGQGGQQMAGGGRGSNQTGAAGMSGMMSMMMPGLA